MTFPNALNASAMHGSEIVLYQEDFAGPNLAPTVDHLGKGPLTYGDSGNLSSALTVIPAPGSTPHPSGGLRLEIDGTQPVTPVSTSLTVVLIPPRVRLLRVVGMFRTVPNIPTGPGPWAAVVLVSERGEADSTSQSVPRITTTMRVTATTARLNTPGSLPAPQSTNRFANLYPAGATNGVDFNLELLLDLTGGAYSASLEAQGFKDTRPISSANLPLLWKHVSVGISLVRVADRGHAAMDVRSLRVSGIRDIGP